MNIDTLNAYCGRVLVARPCLGQGRLKHPSGTACVLRSGLSCRLRSAGGPKVTCAVLCQRLLGRKKPGSGRDKPARGIYLEALCLPGYNLTYLST